MFHSKTLKICILFLILSFAAWKIHIFLKQDSCLDSGNVWDYNENRCRNDCWNWNKINGCIKLTEEQVKLFEKCRHKPQDCISKEVFNEICLNNNLSLNKITGECDTEFTVSKCNKLGNDWIYPAICYEKDK